MDSSQNGAVENNSQDKGDDQCFRLHSMAFVNNLAGGRPSAWLTLFDNLVGMKTIIPPRPLVQLELELEAQAGGLDALHCRILAAKLSRWSHQLQVKARVLESHSGPRPRPFLKRLSKRKLFLN